MRRGFVALIMVLLILSCAITAYAVSAEGDRGGSATVALQLASSGAEYIAEEEAVAAFVQNSVE